MGASNFGLWLIALAVVLIGVSLLGGFDSRAAWVLALILVMGVAVTNQNWTRQISAFSQQLSGAFKGNG